MRRFFFLLLLPVLVHAGDKLTAELYSQQVNGFCRGPIRVLFSEPMIPLGFPTDSTPKGLSVTPTVSGKWTWGSRSTLLFTPDSNWHNGISYTVVVPAGVDSRISKKRLKKTLTKKFSAGTFSGSFSRAAALRPTIDFVKVRFSLRVHPDSLRRHLSGAPKSLELSTSDRQEYLLRPQSGWHGGERITLSIDPGLTPLGGDMPLDSGISTAFTVSDTLACLGLFRNGTEVSPSDTLFLEDGYDLRFNRPLGSEALGDYFRVNGKPYECWASGDRISVNQLLFADKPCTLSFSTGMPSADSAFLFHAVRFVVIGGFNRIDPGKPAFSIKAMMAHWDKDSVMSISRETVIDIRQTLKFEFVLNKAVKYAGNRNKGLIYCFTRLGKDTLDGRMNDSALWVYPRRLPGNSNCTLVVRAGYRTGEFQLKKDFTAIVRTGKIILPNECRPLWGNEYEEYGDYEYTNGNQSGYDDDGNENENGSDGTFNDGFNDKNDEEYSFEFNDELGGKAWSTEDEEDENGRSEADKNTVDDRGNGRWLHPIVNLFPESPAVPLKRFGAPRIVAGMRKVGVKEALSEVRSAPSARNRWRFDTIPGSPAPVNWYEYVPVRLAPALSSQGRGIADVMLSVDGAAFDTLGRYQTTDLGVQLMRGRLVTAVSATSLIKRKPAAGVSISLIGEKSKVLAQGTTDSLGFFLTPRSLNPRFVTASLGGDTLVYMTEESGKTLSKDTLRCYGAILTDRGLYRAGDSVFFKGIVRRLQDRWEKAPRDSAIVTVRWEGTKPFVDTLSLFGCGSFSGSFVVPNEANRRWYTIQAKLRHAKGKFFGGLTVSDFRQIELSVQVGKGRVEGNAVRFPVSANWLHGGCAELSPLSWSCHFHRYGDKTPSDFFTWNGRHSADNDRKASGALFLDKSGSAVIDVPFLPVDSGSTCDFSVSVSASTIQSAQANGTADIPTRKRLCIGFSEHRDGSENDTALLYFKAMRENGDTLRGVRLRADISRREIGKKIVKNRCGLPAIVRDTMHFLVRTDYPVTDSLGIAALQMASMKAGDYFVTIAPQGHDKKETFTYDFHVFKPDTGRGHPGAEADDHRDDRNEFTIGEKDSGVHEVGDTVHLRMTASRDSCRVLLVVSRENLYERRWIAMTGRDTIVPLIVRDAFIPIVKVRASFLPPIRRNRRGLAIIRHSPICARSVNLHVSEESRHIRLQIATDHPSYAPGDSVTVKCRVSPKFRSASGLVMVVDEGVLLRSSASLPGINESFSMEFVGVNHFSTECSFRRIRGPFDYDSLSARRETNAFGIGFGAGYGSGFGGGGGGTIDDIIGGLLGGEEGSTLSLKMGKGMRNPPLPCAYFNPRVSFDASGTALCRFRLPGNLTRWRVTVVVDDTTSFGEDTASFTTTKPLMVRPQLPRFLRLGDSASAVYIVENRSKAALAISSGVAMPRDTAIEKIKLLKDESRQCRFPLIGRAVGEDSLLFFARSDTLADGIKLSFPIIFERPRDMAAIGGSTMDSAVIPVMLPKPEKIDSGSIELSLSTTRMQNLREGIRYLFDYPYGCLEQKSSAIMTLLLLGDFAKRFDLPMLSKGDEKNVIQKYLDHITDFQNDSNGGFRYWPKRSDWTSPWLTAFVMEILNMAKAAGYIVDDRAYSKALKYLLREMRRKDSNGRKWFLDSYTLLVTAKAGKPDRPELLKLYKQEQSLPFSCRINELKAMYIAGGFKKQVAALQKKLMAGLIEKDRLAYVAAEEAHGFEFCHESQVRLTALTMEALLETGMKSRFDEPMIRWLTEQRRLGRWRTTQENLAVFRAFSAFTRVYENESPKLKAAIKLAGKDWWSAALVGREGAFARASRPLDSIHGSGETALSVSRTGSGRLYYDLVLSSFPKGNAPAASSGLTITRKLKPITALTNSPGDPSRNLLDFAGVPGGKPVIVNEADRMRVGELIEVELVIQCNQDITFAAINDPVPAGCEAVDPDLSGGEREIARETTHWSGPAGLSYQEFRDSRVLLFADQMPAGEYRFSYILKPTTAGKFFWPAPIAEAMYYPEIFGRGAEGTVTIEEER